MNQANRAPTWLEPSANAPGVDPRAVELHNRLNGALERGDVIEGLRLMLELKRNFENVGNRTIEVRQAVSSSPLPGIG